MRRRRDRRDRLHAATLRMMQAAAALRERAHRGQGGLLIEIATACARSMSEEHAYAFAGALVAAAVGIVEQRALRT